VTILQTLVETVQSGEEDRSLAAARQAVQGGVAIDAIVEAMTAGMREVGARFARMEIFIPGLMLAARAMQAVMAELEAKLEQSAAVTEKKGTIVIGTVEGDIHEIGKDIVSTLLRTQGFQVYDLGADVNALDFVRQAEQVGADIIGASALMTTTMPGQSEIVELLKELGLRDKYHVIFGGAPVTQEWVDECGADSWGEDAWTAVTILERAMEKKGRK
jgi:corrinoid protein of di/trimethylamine methyltransferase